MTNKRSFVFAIIGILALASFFRFYKLPSVHPGLYPDEAMNGNNALEAIKTNDFKIFYPENNGREGLFINIQALFLKFLLPENGHPEPWMLKLPSAIFGILTVLGVFFLARELFRNYHGNKIALLSSFFLAVSFWHVNFSRIGFRAIMAPFFLTWGIYFLLLSFRKLGSAKNRLLPLLAGTIYGLGFYSYIAYRATPILILAIMILSWLKNKNIKRHILFASLCFIFASIITVLPLLNYFIKNPADFFGRTAQISIFNSPTLVKDLGLNILKTAAMFNFAGDYNWRHNIAGRPLLFWPVGILFLIGLFLSVKNFRKNFILLGWLIVAALPVVISNEGMPHALRAIIMAPPIFILAAWGGVKLYDWFLNRNVAKKFLLAATSSLLAFLVVESYWSYFLFWGKNQEVKNAFSENYLEIGRLVNSLPKNATKYVTVPPGGVTVRGVPMAAQTVMFITDTFLPEKQKEKNIYYINSKNGSLPPGGFVFNL